MLSLLLVIAIILYLIVSVWICAWAKRFFKGRWVFRLVAFTLFGLPLIELGLIPMLFYRLVCPTMSEYRVFSKVKTRGYFTAAETYFSVLDIEEMKKWNIKYIELLITDLSDDNADLPLPIDTPGYYRIEYAPYKDNRCSQFERYLERLHNYAENKIMRKKNMRRVLAAQSLYPIYFRAYQKFGCIVWRQIARPLAKYGYINNRVNSSYLKSWWTPLGVLERSESVIKNMHNNEIVAYARNYSWRTIGIFSQLLNIFAFSGREDVDYCIGSDESLYRRMLRDVFVNYSSG